MKLLLVAPGVDYATADVFRGFLRALRRQGAHDLILYDLDRRFAAARSWLAALWAEQGRGEPPTRADAQYQASRDLVPFALWHQPDWVVVFSALFFSPDVFVLLRRAGVPTAAVLSESPYNDADHERIAPYVDLLFTNERTSVERLRKVNPDVVYLPHAYDPAVHFPAPPDPRVPSHDVLFVGTGFEERIETLAGVDWTGIDLGLYGAYPEDILPKTHPLRRYVRGPIVANGSAAVLYRNAKVNLNLYRTSIGISPGSPRIDHAESLNPRAYELAACGVFQLSDYRAEVDDVLRPAVITFGTPAELQASVRLALADQKGRTVLGHWAHEKIVPHTFDARARTLTDTLAAA